MSLNYNRPIFPVSEKERLIKKITQKHLIGGDVEVVQIEGLLADFVQENEIDFIVRNYTCMHSVIVLMTWSIIGKRNQDLCRL